MRLLASVVLPHPAVAADGQHGETEKQCARGEGGQSTRWDTGGGKSGVCTTALPGLVRTRSRAGSGRRW